MLNTKIETGGGCGCLIFLAIAAFNMWIGGTSVNYILFMWFDVDVPTWADVVMGLFVAELSIPAAIVTYIINLF